MISSKIEKKHNTNVYCSLGPGLGFWNTLFHLVIIFWEVNDGLPLTMDDLRV